MATGSRAQKRALAHVAARAREARAAARSKIEEILEGAGEPVASIDALVARVREHAAVTVSFHPDRLLADGRTVAEALLREGRYRSQFETRISNGSRTAFAGGDRDRWEETLFGGAYHDCDVAAEDRPRYGALDLMQHADGGSPRFGSCYFELRPHMTSRCTLTWGDSHERPEHVGTIDVFDALLASLLESAATSREVLGAPNMDVTQLVAYLRGLERRAPQLRARGVHGRALDAYIEAQIHADIDLAADVQALVVDPSFIATETGESLRALCSRYGVAFVLHPGFVLATSDVPDDFRGPRMVPLAARVERRFATRGGQLDAATIGRAARSLALEPRLWDDWASVDETLQHLKQLWHVLVKFGAPR